ncbi:lipase family protein [Umezawaea tangerina]|uniref:Ca2+-binding EF-hand superfamily protein n=1 Tax=Umezawaea tangerina TaxID=84725 RepID=A0A2T0T094_9PSEU|nr:lipase family protein [Umezawaea tangerina]PRY39080.1 Ca2+-binding EF-hand superfamily protein [Umezawaea tangerina]
MDPHDVPEPGTLLGHEPLPSAYWPSHTAEATRVLYQGVGYDGASRAVSGSVFLPIGEPPPGGWPVVAFAHGTTGLSDRCAPSRTGLSRLEREHVARWLAAGHVVAATDYEGLSSAGPHPYFNGEAVADDVVDIVRATRRLHDRASASWLVAGFSQGAHAALFVGLMASRYAPDLDFRGTVALAPLVHLPLLVDVLTGDGTRPVSILLPFLLAGLRTSHPDFDARPFLTDVGGRLVDVASTATLVDMFRAIGGQTNDTAGTTGIRARPGIDPVLHACRVPVARMDRPVYLTAGDADEVVPVAVVERFVADLRATGTPVRYDRHPGATHADVLAAGHDSVIAWSTTLGRCDDPQPPKRFTALDADGDGRLTEDDFEVFALRLVQALGRSPGSPSALTVRHRYRDLWRALAARSDQDLDGAVSGPEYVRWLGTTTRDDGFDRNVRPLAEAVVRLVDTDGSGVVDAAELTRVLRACGLSPDEARTTLAAVDRDHDGVVSVAEIVDVVRDFCLDPAPGRPGHWLFGRS